MWNQNKNKNKDVQKILALRWKQLTENVNVKEMKITSAKKQTKPIFMCDRRNEHKLNKTIKHLQKWGHCEFIKKICSSTKLQQKQKNFALSPSEQEWGK